MPDRSAYFLFSCMLVSFSLCRFCVCWFCQWCPSSSQNVLRASPFTIFTNTMYYDVMCGWRAFYWSTTMPPKIQYPSPAQKANNTKKRFKRAPRAWERKHPTPPPKDIHDFIPMRAGGFHRARNTFGGEKKEQQKRGIIKHPKSNKEILPTKRGVVPSSHLLVYTILRAKGVFARRVSWPQAPKKSCCSIDRAGRHFVG